MAVSLVGYEFLRQHLHLSAFACTRPARIGNVTKVTQRPDRLDVPAAVAPASQAPLAHLLFALKHEGINLQVLAQSLPQIAADPGRSDHRGLPEQPGQQIHPHGGLPVGAVHRP